MLFVAVLTLPGLVEAQQQVGAVRSLADIEQALDPLEFVANYGGVRYAIDLHIQFDFDSDVILPAARQQVDALGQALAGERLASHRFRIIGHTDAVGSAEYNQALSERRAGSVARALIEEYGIEADRLQIEGRGFSEPRQNIAPDAAEQRRVEIVTITDGAPDDQESEQPTVGEDGTLRIDW